MVYKYSYYTSFEFNKFTRLRSYRVVVSALENLLTAFHYICINNNN